MAPDFLGAAVVVPTLPPLEEPTVSAASLDERPAYVDAYLVGTPLSGQGAAMVAAADRWGIDYRMLPAISLYESTWGRYACGYNYMGYASCEVTFSSYEEAHEVAASTLAGYGGDDGTKLCIWNQGSSGCRAGLGWDYSARVAAEMERIGPAR